MIPAGSIVNVGGEAPASSTKRRAGDRREPHQVGESDQNHKAEKASGASSSRSLHCARLVCFAS